MFEFISVPDTSFNLEQELDPVSMEVLVTACESIEIVASELKRDHIVATATDELLRQVLVWFGLGRRAVGSDPDRCLFDLGTTRECTSGCWDVFRPGQQSGFKFSDIQYTSSFNRGEYEFNSPRSICQRIRHSTASHSAIRKYLRASRYIRRVTRAFLTVRRVGTRLEGCDARARLGIPATRIPHAESRPDSISACTGSKALVRQPAFKASGTC
ncbi:hypothetical protein C8R43DRAFT_1143651 [Mycena crocata]|nr:hypothetical protein C8R43DRAFT_1143651 [Mycena crocata]